jgi:hypothetical protein
MKMDIKTIKKVSKWRMNKQMKMRKGEMEMEKLQFTIDEYIKLCVIIQSKAITAFKTYQL